ncbi:MAG: hypothetical protein HOO99_04140 [Hyphomicrobiaceae bacterium]|nr:hypothetical protein [Hyphomicrobiaceae bacterium]
MRVSIVDGDPGQIPYAELRNAGNDVRVLLDGVEQNDCTTADDKYGVIYRYARDSAGVLIDDGKELVVERVTGRVEIVIFKRSDSAG